MLKVIEIQFGNSGLLNIPCGQLIMALVTLGVVAMLVNVLFCRGIKR